MVEAVKGELAPAEWARIQRVRAAFGADLVVAPTAASLRDAERHYGPFGASRVIRNGRWTLSRVVRHGRGAGVRVRNALAPDSLAGEESILRTLTSLPTPLP